MEQLICPVPKEQRPTSEFEELRQSWFFSIPFKESGNLNKFLTISWFCFMPLTLLVSSGSIELSHKTLELIIISCCFTFLIPLLLLLRLWLGWNYILKRLISENIVYEESGWYDGQTWEKTIEFRQKDILIAQYEVYPILSNIKNSFTKTILFTITFIILYTIINVKY
tara:strand:- start:598 stop:1101 length:504 start_codon:yes stop_codon:yes gene_type:complete